LVTVCRIEFVAKKGRIGGDKRKISFTRGAGDGAVLRTSGIITKDAVVAIGDGLPSDTSNRLNISMCYT
jgi:hypothetical protein